MSSSAVQFFRQLQAYFIADASWYKIAASVSIPRINRMRQAQDPDRFSALSDRSFCATTQRFETAAPLHPSISRSKKIETCANQNLPLDCDMIVRFKLPRFHTTLSKFMLSSSTRIRDIALPTLFTHLQKSPHLQIREIKETELECDDWSSMP